MALTAALTTVSELSYRHNERRLLALQTKLTGLVLSMALGQVQANLDRVAGLAAEAPVPAATFARAISSYMAPRGPYASSSLTMVKDGRATVLAHLGVPAYRDLNSPQVIELFLKAAHSSNLETSRAVKGGSQKLGYLVSAPGQGAIFVVGAGQQLPAVEISRVPPSSPDANLNFALYFGRATTPAALIDTSARHLPLSGTVARVSVPFGDNVLTLIASPRGSLAGAWSEYIPWAVLAGGVLVSLTAASLSEWLFRRRAEAESLLALHRQWYQRQRSISEDLQRALLPKTLPEIAGMDLAARYIPGTREIEIGGDWYSVVPVDGDNFVFVVGDVSGHDSTAAGIMASLRYSTRALAQLGMGPTELLDRAGAELDLRGDDHFATVLVGKVDTARRKLTLASAGHLPPLLVKGGQVEIVKLAAGVPLGVHGQPPEATTVAFGPGSTVVAFTDGLIEKRGEDLNEGLGRLVSAASTTPGTAERLIEHILSTLATPDHEDDIAILAIQSVRPHDQ